MIDLHTPLIGLSREELLRRAEHAECFIRARGYITCDIPACNCNSWHGGHAERRLDEIQDELDGYGVSFDGRTLLDVLKTVLRGLPVRRQS